MLILTRRIGEKLMIGDEVTVTVLGVKGNQVRIGVRAPNDVPVHREEVYSNIHKESGDENKPTLSLAGRNPEHHHSSKKTHRHQQPASQASLERLSDSFGNK